MLLAGSGLAFLGGATPRLSLPSLLMLANPLLFPTRLFRAAAIAQLVDDEPLSRAEATLGARRGHETGMEQPPAALTPVCSCWGESGTKSAIALNFSSNNHR